MAEPREIKVKLTADTSEYIKAMKRATKVTRRFQRRTSWGNAAWYGVGFLVGVTGGFGAALFIGIVH